MNSKLYVGNLNWDTTDEALKEYFETVGTVLEAVVIRDRVSQRSKGFGFVTMSSEEEAQKAIEELNGTELEGRPIKVDEARPPKDKTM